MNTKVLATAALACIASGCTFHSTATHWNGRVGPDGVPVYVHTTTNIGFNLLIVVPFLGNTTIDTMIDTMTAEIANNDGDHVRMIESAAENYWYGWPPLTWIVTPVVTTVTGDYQPSAERFAADEAERAAEAAADSD